MSETFFEKTRLFFGEAKLFARRAAVNVDAALFFIVHASWSCCCCRCCVPIIPFSIFWWYLVYVQILHRRTSGLLLMVMMITFKNKKLVYQLLSEYLTMIYIHKYILMINQNCDDLDHLMWKKNRTERKLRIFNFAY